MPEIDQSGEGVETRGKDEGVGRRGEGEIEGAEEAEGVLNLS
jgi:hypothetical protein